MSRPIGPDVDLDQEDIRTADGRRLTAELAGGIAERALTEARRGRPSVSGGAVRTPNLTIRVPMALRVRLQKIADAQGRRVADVGRDALADYAKRHAVAETGTGTHKSVAKAAPAKAPAKKAEATKAAARKAAPRKRTTAS